MLGRKSFTSEEIERARTTFDAQLAAYRKLAKAAKGAALDSFAAQFFNNLTLALDRFFVHRLRVLTGKDTTPLNELEIIADSLLNHDGVFTGIAVIKYVPEKAVIGLKTGDRIQLGEDDFARLYAAVLGELAEKAE